MDLLCNNAAREAHTHSRKIGYEKPLIGGRCMSLKAWALVCASAFAVIIVGAIIGNMLESSGTLTDDDVRYKGQNMVQFLFFLLFCLLCFTIVPFVIKLFIVMQIKIGHGEFFMIKWLQAHQQKVIYVLWSILVIGFSIALPSAIKDGMFK